MPENQLYIDESSPSLICLSEGVGEGVKKFKRLN
jgi:hypothetical protein